MGVRDRDRGRGRGDTRGKTPVAVRRWPGLVRLRVSKQEQGKREGGRGDKKFVRDGETEESEHSVRNVRHYTRSWVEVDITLCGEAIAASKLTESSHARCRAGSVA